MPGQFKLDDNEEPIYFPSDEELKKYESSGELPIDIAHPSRFPNLDHFSIRLEDLSRKPRFAEFRGGDDDITVIILDSTHSRPKKSLEFDREEPPTELLVEWQRKDNGGYSMEFTAIYKS